ncbi:hypothetical protein U1Q18_013113 [Sarracenia purpurea var. burkii]
MMLPELQDVSDVTHPSMSCTVWHLYASERNPPSYHSGGGGVRVVYSDQQKLSRRCLIVEQLVEVLEQLVEVWGPRALYFFFSCSTTSKIPRSVIHGTDRRFLEGSECCPGGTTELPHGCVVRSRRVLSGVGGSQPNAALFAGTLDLDGVPAP